MKKRKAGKAKRHSYRKLWREQVKDNEKLRLHLRNLEDRYVQLDQMTENEARSQGTAVYLACLAKHIKNALGDGLTVLSGVRRLCLERKMQEYPVGAIKTALLSEGVLEKVVDGVLEANASEMELASRKRLVLK